MARDYKNIKKDTPRKDSGFNTFLTFLSGLSLGLLVAVIVFFYRDELAETMKLPGFASTPAEQAVLTTATDSSDEKSALPEPTFEFYNILPNKEVDISAWVTKAPAATDSPEEKGNYILQVGSFKQHKAADEVKAKLALLGFKAYIEPGVINGEGVFRVRMGPYHNLTRLKSARERLLANNLDFMQMRL